LTVTASVGAGVALIPVTDVAGVTTSGLAWKLERESLRRGTSRGLSNRSIQPGINVTISSGVLLVTVEGAPTQ
jgi:thiamine pyrophosphokinase